MPTAESVNEMIAERKQQAQDALDKVKETFSSLEAKLSGGISMDSVKKSLNELTGKLNLMADNPGSVLGAAGCIAACVFPLAELGKALRDAAGQIGGIAVNFTNGVVDRIMDLVNDMISGLKGIGAAITTTMAALSEIGPLLSSVSAAFMGDAAAKIKCADDIEVFTDKADLKLTSKLIDKIFGSLAKISKSADLDVIIESITGLASFLAEVPGRLKKVITPNACAAMCISLPAQLKTLLDQMEAFGKMFNAGAITTALKYAKKNAGTRAHRGVARRARFPSFRRAARPQRPRAVAHPRVRPPVPRRRAPPPPAGMSASAITGPLDSLDKALGSAASSLKMLAKTG
jgi:hypothetical protein